METGETALKPVTDLIHRHERVIWEVTLRGAEGAAAAATFETTDDHPWWVPGQGWVDTDRLAPGLPVLTRDGQQLIIARVVPTDRVDATYNLSVADFETYFVGDLRILVHNCLPKPGHGRGAVEKGQRDPKRGFTPKERELKRQEQNNQCANCGTPIDENNSEGHHIVRHADGGPTKPENHAEVCEDCHTKIHRKPEVVCKDRVGQADCNQ